MVVRALILLQETQFTTSKHLGPLTNHQFEMDQRKLLLLEKSRKNKE